MLKHWWAAKIEQVWFALSDGEPQWLGQAQRTAVPTARALDCMELEDRTVCSASPIAAAAHAAPSGIDARQSPLANLPANNSDAQVAPLSVDLSGSGAAAQANGANHAVSGYGNLPLSFEANRGQTDRQVDFLARGTGYSVFLSHGDAVLALKNADGSFALRLNLLGANANPDVAGSALQSGRSNYLLGNDQRQWITDVPLYGGVTYKNVYSGVDVQYHANQQQLEYDFVLAAGANPNQIRLAFQGAQERRIDANGDLVLTLPGTSEAVRFHAPVAYQDTDHGRVAVASQYRIGADGEVGFQLGAYDASRPLVIDPVLAYGTFLGSLGVDQAQGIAVDALGNAFVAGQTNSFLFPTTFGALGTILRGGSDLFVTKLNPAGNGLVYSTYIGGFGNDVAWAIATDVAGNAYVTGSTTSFDFPTVNAFQNSIAGGQDAFFLKLNATGTGLAYSTFYGGVGGSEVAFGIAVDPSGNAYVAGQTNANSGIASAGAYQTSNGGQTDAFLVKFDPSLSGAASRVFGTYLGGSNKDYGYALAVDAAGQAYVVGYTGSGDFPTTANAYSMAKGGGNDAFLTIVNAAGNGLVYSTYLGGFGNDGVDAVVLDAANHVYLSGWAGNGFPTTAGAYDTTYGGGASDGYVAELDPSQSGAASLVYATYVGGAGTDVAYGIAVDSFGRAHVDGYTSGFFPTTAGAYQTAYGGGPNDAFLATIAPGGGSLVYSTYLGGSGDDIGFAIANDSSGGVYLAGYTNSSNFQETTPGAFDTALNGGIPTGNYDAFVVKFVYNSSNSAPVLAGSNNLLSINEDAVANGGTPVAALIAGNVADADAGAQSGIAVTAVDNSNGSWEYSLNAGGSWSAIGSPSQGAALLLAADANTFVRFVPNADWNGTVTGGITFRAWDRTFGSAGAAADVTTNGGTTAFSSAQASADITVIAVNDPPVVAAPGPQTTPENTPFVFSAANGNAVSISDVDAGANPILVSLTVTNGTLTLNGTAGLIFVTGTGTNDAAMQFSGSIASIDAALDGMKFAPSLNYQGAVGLGITANDLGNSGAGGPQLGIQGVGITVQQVNAAPTGTSNSVTTLEDSPYVFTAADFGFADPNDTPANNLLAVEIATLPAAGTVTDNGTAVSAGQFVPAADIIAGKLVFTPAANANGANYASFKFQVQDDGGTANGGVDVDPVAKTMTINVTPVNDSPVGTGNTITMAEDTVHVFTAADFGFTDPNDAPANNLLAVKIANLPGAGTLSDNGVAVSAGQFVSVSDINSGKLVFAPAANANGVNYASFKFQVQDDGGTSKGGVDVDPVAKTMNIDVKPINDAPVLSGPNNLAAINENDSANGGTLVSALIAGKVTDADAGALTGIAVTAVNNANGVWQYSTNGGGIWTAFGSPSQAAARLLAADANTAVRLVPNANFAGTVVGGITFRAWDQTSGVAGGVADVSANGGKAAFSAATASASIAVNAIPITPINPGPTPPGTTTTTTGGNPGTNPPITISNGGSSSGGSASDNSAGSEGAGRPSRGSAGGGAPSGARSSGGFANGQASADGQAQPDAASAEALLQAAEQRGPNDRSPGDPRGPSRGSARLNASSIGNLPANRGEDLSFAGEGSALWHDLDLLSRQLHSRSQLEKLLVGSAVTISTGLSVGYVVWMLRGGLLISSLVAQMPAWRLVDPLVVLSHLDDDLLDNGDEGSRESLVTIVDSLENTTETVGG